MAPWYEWLAAGAYLGNFCGIIYGAYWAIRWCAFHRPNLTAGVSSNRHGPSLGFGELHYWPGVLVMIGLFLKYSALER